MSRPTLHRMYDELASWWPLISPPEEYREEAKFLAGLFDDAPRTVADVLELGSGGGHNASYLKARFNMTLVDLSASMLAVSRSLNPECEHLVGDMRTVRLSRAFDGVLIHDAIDYMTTENDLAAALSTASVHCRPGGIVVVAPDDTVETFSEGAEHGGVDAPDGRGIRYLGWSWDPDPSDTWVQTEYVFVTRTATGKIDVHHESHKYGLFPASAWLRILAKVGFEPRMIEADGTAPESRPRFVGVRRADRADE